MPAVVGVFKSRSDAEGGIAKLREIGVPTDKISLLTPQATEKELAATDVPGRTAENGQDARRTDRRGIGRWHRRDGRDHVFAGRGAHVP